MELKSVIRGDKMREKNESQIEKQYYNRRDIERLIGCGTSKAYEIIRNEIPHIRLGRKILIPKEEFEKWQREKNLTARTEYNGFFSKKEKNI